MKVVGKIIYILYRWKHLDERERNQVIWSGKYRKFCENEYIEIPPEI